MTLRRRIFLAFAALIAFAAVSIPLSLATQRNLVRQSEQVADLYQLGTRHLAAIASAAQQLRLSTDRFGQALEATSASRDLLVSLGADLLMQWNSLNERLAERDRFTGQAPDPVEQEYLSRYRDALDALLRDIDRRGPRIAAPERTAARSALSTAKQQARLLEEQANQRLHAATDRSARLINDAARASDAGMRRLVAWLTGYVLLGIGLALVIARSVTRPIGRLMHQIDAIGRSSQLTTTTGLGRRKDEIGLLARHFDAMIVRLRDTLVSRDFLNAILESIPAAIVVSDPDGNVLFANATSRKWFGAALDRLPPYSDEPLEWTVVENEFRRTLLVSRARIGPGPGTGHTVLVATDITIRRELEQQQEQTVAMLTHDLKTPLTSLSGVLSLLDETEISDAPDRRRLYEAGTRNVQRMLDLIQDMLELHRLRRGDLHLQSEMVCPRDLVTDVVTTMAPAASETGVTLRTGRLDDGNIVADPQRLRQVLENLCSNALRYAGQGATATVDVIATNDTIRIDVTDTGPGIPDAIRPLLFQPFQTRAAGHKPHPDSTGLGLATAKLLIERMNASLHLAHTGPQGTRFSITFARA